MSGVDETLELIIIAVIFVIGGYFAYKQLRDDDDKKKPGGYQTHIVTGDFKKLVTQALAILEQHPAASADLHNRISLIQEMNSLGGANGRLNPPAVINLSLDQCYNNARRDKQPVLYVAFVIAHEIGHAVYGPSEKRASNYARLVLRELKQPIPAHW